eukprot:m.53547 g.53547  ORF g.53547 m.53547 type:complete len:1217 (+) comp7465_c0_seq1:63-3713(+)
MASPMVHWDPATRRVSWIGIDAGSLPSEFRTEYASASEVDISEGCLNDLSGLESFRSLESLVADSNELTTLDTLPPLPKLTTLSLNKNKITDAHELARDLAAKCPRLAHVSLLGNPCCPSEIFGGTAEKYAEYRHVLLKKLPGLRSIDFAQVADNERPKNVETISAQKLAKGAISQEEHDHIVKMHRLLASLDMESSGLLASSDEESWDDEDEEDDDDDESLPPTPLDALSPLSDRQVTPSGRVNLRPPLLKERLPELSKMDSLNVFSKIVTADMIHASRQAELALARGPSRTAAPSRSPGGASSTLSPLPEDGATPNEGGAAGPTTTNESDVPFLYRKASAGSTGGTPSPSPSPRPRPGNTAQGGGRPSAASTEQPLSPTTGPSPGPPGPEMAALQVMNLFRSARSSTGSGSSGQPQPAAPLTDAPSTAAPIEADTVAAAAASASTAATSSEQSNDDVPLLFRKVPNANTSMSSPDDDGKGSGEGGGNSADDEATPGRPQTNLSSSALTSPDEFPDAPRVPSSLSPSSPPPPPQRSTPTLTRKGSVAEKIHDLEVTADLGDLRVLTLERGPTGVDMQILKDSQYIRVAIVTPKGAAHTAGLAVGDVILSCNGVGLMGASTAEAEAALLESPVCKLHVAASSLPIPVFDRPLSRSSQGQAGFAIGARSPSHAIRPLYCEIQLPRLPGNDKGSRGFGFTVNVQGLDPLVDTVVSGTTAIHAGDVIKSVDGNFATVKNVHALLDAADDPASLDVIRYRIDTTSSTPLPADGDGGGAHGVGGAAGGDGASGSGEAPKFMPPAIAFDAIFNGSITVDSLKDTAKEGQMIRRASKQAIKETKKKDDVLKPGKVRVSITPFSIVTERVVKLTKRQKTAGVQPPGEHVFEITTDDLFSAVARKRKILLMVQPDPPRPGVCYILKFPTIKACKRAAVACGSLPGHVAYEAPAKRRLKKKQARKKAKRKGGDATADTTDTTILGVSTSGTPTPVARSNASVAGGATSGGDLSGSGNNGGTAPRRRKLVRGGNAQNVPVLPEFQDALEAITDLDGFLDKHSTFRGNATSLAPLAQEYSRRDNDNNASASGGGSGGGSEGGMVLPSQRGNDAAAGTDEDEEDEDETDAETETDTEAEGDADLEFFKVLAAKREEREIEAANRRAQLAAESARLRDELNAQRSLEMAQIARERERDRLLAERYKEYCAVGAEERLKDLTFKFKWKSAD